MTEPRSQDSTTGEGSRLETAGLIAGVLGLTALLFAFILYALDPDVLALSLGNAGFGAVALVFYAFTNGRKLTRQLAGRRTMLVLLEGGQALGAISVVVAINVAGEGSTLEWDLTRDGLFSLHSQSIEVLAKLKKPVKLVGFYRPTDKTRAVLQQAKDVYSRYSDKVLVEFINPDSAPPSVISRYQMTAKSPRIVVVGPSGQETKIRNATEEEITNAIIKVASRPPRKIYFLSGHQEPGYEDRSLETGYSVAAGALRDQGFDLSALSLVSDAEPIPEDASVIIMAGAQKPYFPHEAEALKTWLDRGGRVLALIEPIVAHGLDRLFEGYGVVVGDDVVVEPDASARAAGFGPEAPIVQKFEPHAITNPLLNSAALFYLTRSIQPKMGIEHLTVTTLVQTSATSWGETSYRTATEHAREENDVPGPVPIAAAITKNTAMHPTKMADEARMVVFGDHHFPNNRYSGMAGNMDLFLNSINWLAGDEDRITIQLKQRGASRIPLTEAQQYGIMFFSVNFLPLLIVGFGFSVWAIRRRK